MDKCLGFGGLGDCFIVGLKLMEYPNEYVYVHIDNSKSRLTSSMYLMEHLGIPAIGKVVKNIKRWWYTNHNQFDKCFNVFANGYIDIPKRDYHWEPCRDEGYKNPYRKELKTKTDFIAVQINSGGQRSYKYKPIIEYVYANYDRNKILWFGTDTEFHAEYGTNYCGKIDFISALEKISECKYFVGFNSVLLYWSLWNKLDCFLFTDHQGKEDLRIHKEWKKHLEFDI